MTYIDELKEIYPDLLLNEPMSRHTSFKTGGPADIFIKADDVGSIVRIIKLANKYNEKYFIMGNGSNLLVKDGGIEGTVIQIAGGMSGISYIDGSLYAEAGVLLSSLSAAATGLALTGLEFASGIPGTVGGAVFMNAGAYDGEIKKVIEYADAIDENGIILRLSRDELKLSYRHSIVGYKRLILIGASFRLEEGNKNTIEERVRELAKKRREKQPLEFPSAGSTFKRPEGHFAGKLIEDCGLKGKRIGGAEVSQKHAGFIINRDNATSADILELINYCIKRVYDEYRVKLVPEVRIIGRD